jgi:hypothetical protein
MRGRDYPYGFEEKREPSRPELPLRRDRAIVSALFWLAGGGVAVLLSESSRPARSRSRYLAVARSGPSRGVGVAVAAFVGVDRGRVLGVLAGAALAHVGWVAVHAAEILRAGGMSALGSWLLDLGSGASMLFVPLGPLAVRTWRDEPAARVDGDLRALIPGLAIARIGCVVDSCCGGRAAPRWLVEVASFTGASIDAIPTAGLSVAGLTVLAACTRRPGRAPFALAGLASLRLALEPLRAAPAHGGATTWVYILALLWLTVAIAIAWTSRAGRRTPRPPAP